MAITLTRLIICTSFSIIMTTGICLSAEPTEVGKFVKARIEIGEMMTNYFSGGRGYGGEGRPSPDRMREMRADINNKLSKLLAKYDLTPEEYRQRSLEVFKDDAAVQRYLNKHPSLKQRYESLPLDRMGRGRSGRGY